MTEKELLKNIGQLLIKINDVLEEKEAQFKKDNLNPLSDFEKEMKEQSQNFIRSIKDIVNDIC